LGGFVFGEKNGAFSKLTTFWRKNWRFSLNLPNLGEKMAIRLKLTYFGRKIGDFLPHQFYDYFS
jgi:hypothetical protein